MQSGHFGYRAASQVAVWGELLVPETFDQRLHRQGAGQTSRSSVVRDSDKSSKASQTAEMVQEILEYGFNSKYRDVNYICSLTMDGACEEKIESSDKKKSTKSIIRARPSLPHASTFSALDAARRISAAGQAFKSNSDSSFFKPLSPVETARSISAAGHRIKRRSSPSHEELRSSFTMRRTGVSRARTARSGTFQPESRQGSIASTVDEPSRTATGSKSSQTAPVGGQANRSPGATSRRWSTLRDTRLPRGVLHEPDRKPRGASGTKSSIDLSKASSSATRPNPASGRSLLTGARSATTDRLIPKAATASARASTSREPAAAQLSQAQIRSRPRASEMGTETVPAQPPGEVATLLQMTSGADVPCGATSLPYLHRSQRIAEDDLRLRFSAQERGHGERMGTLPAARPSPEASSTTRRKSRGRTKRCAVVAAAGSECSGCGDDRREQHPRQGSIGDFVNGAG